MHNKYKYTVIDRIDCILLLTLSILRNQGKMHFVVVE